MGYEFMDAQDIEREKKKSRGFIFIAATVVVLAILLFAWGAFINKGTLKITGDAPFTVEVFNGKTFTCKLSPCEIRIKGGITDLVIRKEGYESILTDAQIKFLRTVDLEVDFQISPQISRAQAIPEEKNHSEYKLIFDENTQMQGLIKSGDERKEIIVYFPKTLKKAKIYGSENFALVAGENTYKVDIKNKIRQKITLIKNIENGKWSEDGQYFIFSKKDTDNLWLLDGAQIKQLEIMTGILQTAWVYGDNLIFATEQSYKSETKYGEYGDKYISPLAQKAMSGITFASYHTDENSYTLIGAFSEIMELPESLIATSSGDTIYFRSRGENFKIVLKPT